jgi:uncharacterized membrane protein (DUF485 family)
VSFSGGIKPPKLGFWKSVKQNGFWKAVGERDSVQKFIKSPKFDNLLLKANDFAWFESVLMCLIAVTIKPTTIMALPKAKEEDKKYAATKAFLGGIVDFGISTALVLPVTGVFEKFNERVKKDPKIITDKVAYLRDEKKLKNFKKLMEYSPKMLLVPVRSAITIALIPPTLKYLFPEEAKRKAEKKKLENGEIVAIKKEGVKK